MSFSVPISNSAHSNYLKPTYISQISNHRILDTVRHLGFIDTLILKPNPQLSHSRKFSNISNQSGNKNFTYLSFPQASSDSHPPSSHLSSNPPPPSSHSTKSKTTSRSSISKISSRPTSTLATASSDQEPTESKLSSSTLSGSSLNSYPNRDSLTPKASPTKTSPIDIQENINSSSSSASSNSSSSSSSNQGESRSNVSTEETLRAICDGGDAVSSVIKTIIHALDGMEEIDDATVHVAVVGAVAGHIDLLDRSFMLALDFMTKQADKDCDTYRKKMLLSIKDEVLRQLSSKFPAQVKVMNMLVTIKDKELRNKVICRAVSGGGHFDSSGNTLKTHEIKEKKGVLFIPGTSLAEIVAQSDDLISTLETQMKVQERKLLYKLIIIREEAKSLMAGGVYDSRNDLTKFKNLNQPEVKLISNLVSIPLGPLVRDKLKRVIEGNDEGKDIEETEEMKNMNPLERRKLHPLPVRPGMLLVTITKLISQMYKSSGSAVTVRQLEWMRTQCLEILQENAFA